MVHLSLHTHSQDGAAVNRAVFRILNMLITITPDPVRTILAAVQQGSLTGWQPGDLNPTSITP